ncbi:mucin-19 [Hyalella azteca]|uniref:Mucin-19 n=1 Tax=Hyalella azteca TaxID=294128 RepID=A0A8B7N1A5_HYAAZ|nr:mucin-19 [Hyalella azteca]
MAEDEKSCLLNEHTLKDCVTKTSSKTEINEEKAYDVVANYSEEDLRDFLACVSTGNKGNKDTTKNEKSTIAQILLERETAVLREESGSGDDSPDSSKQNQFSRSKPRHSSTRFLYNRYGSQSSHRIHSSYSFDLNHGKSSAAARNTAGSLGSLHDLSNCDARSSAQSSSAKNTSSHCSAGRAGQGAASKCCVDQGAGQEECVGVNRPPPLKTYSRVRTGGSCGNLSRSSFDTQPPGSRKKNRRSKGSDPASTSTREGGSLQNLSKAECSREDVPKGLQKSGSLSQVFTEENDPPKHKSRRQKASSETQHRASEERSLRAQDSTSSDDEDEVSSYPPYQPLLPHHSPLLSRRELAASGGVVSCEHSGCPSPASPISSNDEPMSVEVEEMRRCAYTTTAASAAADAAAVDAAAAAACLGAAISAGALQDPGEELVEVITHTALRDTTHASWLEKSASPSGRRRSTSPHSTAVDSQVPFFSRTTITPSRNSDGRSKNSYGRSHSIESNAYSNKSADERGSEREKLQTQHSEPSQLGRRKDNSIDCPSPSSHIYSTSGSSHCTFPGSSSVGASHISPVELGRDHNQRFANRLKQSRVKKKRQQEVQTVDTSSPSYKGDQDIGSILVYLGEECSDVTSGDPKKKKRKQDNSMSKKDDKKDSTKRGVGSESLSKKNDDTKDDHKKEDSGGGGTNDKKKRQKEEKKVIASNNEDNEASSKKTKKELIEKELKKNGFITPSSSLDCSVAASEISNYERKSSLDGSYLGCDTTSSVRSNLESSKNINSISDTECKTSIRKHSEDKTVIESVHKINNKKTDERKQSNSSCVNPEASNSKRSKKNSKSNQGMRESSSVEDLVSKCRMSEQLNQGSKQTTVDDGAMTKKRQQKNARRQATETSLPSSNSSTATATFKENQNTKEKNRRTVDDIKIKSSSGANKSGSGSSSLANSKKLSKRLSSSNSNLNSSTKSSEFGRDFYEAGDPYIESLPHNEASVYDTNNEFELVTRRKNRSKRLASSSYNNSNNYPVTVKLRYPDENFGRDGYRELVYQKSQLSRNQTNTLAPNNQQKFSSNASHSSNYCHGNDSHAAAKVTSNIGKKPINFDEAPRTPHDGSFMARLSATNSGDRNTATSAPNSDCSDSDGDDSVHSMPTPSTTPRPEVCKPPSSSSAAPLTSYANIARLASAANRNQVKRLTSAPQVGKTPTVSTSTPCSVGASGGYSAAACATSDQSLLTTNAWPCLSATTATVANSGAATSAPAIPSVVRWASGPAGRPGDSQHVTPSFGSPPKLTSAAVAAHDAKPQNKIRDNFPPLKSPSYPSSFSHRQTSTDSDPGLPYANPAENLGKTDGGNAKIISASDARLTVAPRTSLTPDTESSLSISKNLNPSPTDRSISNKPRAGAPSSVVENTTDRKAVTSKEVRPHTGRVMNGHEETDQAHAEIISVGERKASLITSEKQAVAKQKSLNHDAAKLITSVNSTKASADSLGVGDKNHIFKIANKAKDTKKRQNDPVVFADSLHLDDVRNSNLTFMFASNEDLTNIVVSGTNVSAKNLVNSTASLTRTSPKVKTHIDSNGNPVSGAGSPNSGDISESHDNSVSYSESLRSTLRKNSRDSSCSSNCTVINAASATTKTRAQSAEMNNSSSIAVVSADATLAPAASADVNSAGLEVTNVNETKEERVICDNPSSYSDLSRWGVTFHPPDADDPAWNFKEAVKFIRDNWKIIEKALQEGDDSIVTLNHNSNIPSGEM